MADFCTCSACGADLRGPAIPKESLKYYGDKETCEYGCNGPQHYSRLIGVYNRDTDRTEQWMCPDCGHREMRFK